MIPSPRSSTPNLHGHVVSQVERLVLNRRAVILDLGCGSGALLDRLAGMGYRNLAGVDIAPPSSNPGVTYHQADLDHLSLPLPNGSVDLAMAVEVIEHLENPGLFLGELGRLVKTGGLVLFTTPNLHSSQAKLLLALRDRLKQFDHKGDPTHITPIYLFPFTRLLGRHGFEVGESWGFPLDGSSPTSRPITRMMARLLRPLMPSSIAHGDNLCLIAYRTQSHWEADGSTKRQMIISHYG